VADFVKSHFQTAQAIYNAVFTSNISMVSIGGQAPSGLNSDSLIYFMFGQTKSYVFQENI
jgi:hypothetical protein